MACAGMCAGHHMPLIDSICLSFQLFRRIRAQYYLVIVMGIICIGNCFTKLWSTKFVQQNFLLTSYSFTKVEIPQSYFYLIIRFLSTYQSSYFTKLQVTLNFSDKLHILNANNIVKSLMLVLNNLKI